MISSQGTWFLTSAMQLALMLVRDSPESLSGSPRDIFFIWLRFCQAEMAYGKYWNNLIAFGPESVLLLKLSVLKITDNFIII